MGKKKRGGGKGSGHNAGKSGEEKPEAEAEAASFSGAAKTDFPELGGKPELKQEERKVPEEAMRGRGRGIAGLQQPLNVPKLPQAPAREQPTGLPADLQQFPALSITEKPLSAPVWSKNKEVPLPGQVSSSATVTSATAASSLPVKQSDKDGEIKPGGIQNISPKKQSIMSPAKAESLIFEAPRDLPRSTKSYKPIPRPGYGTKGIKIPLRANFFKLEFRDDQVIYHYDIDIKPEMKNKEKTRLIVDTFVRDNKSTLFNGILTIFDGRKNMYTNKALKLPTSKVKFEIKLNDDNPKMKPFILTIQYAAQCSLSSITDFYRKKAEYSPQAVQSLDVALRETPNHRHIPLGQYFFTMVVNGASLPEPGIQLWSGCYQSVRPGWKCMMLQVDTSVRVFHKGQRVVDLCAEFFRCTVNQLKDRPLHDNEHREFESHIKGLQIEIDTERFSQLTRRSYKLIGLSKQISQLQTFPMAQPDGKEIPTKVGDYFKSQYKINLEFPDLHCLQAQPADKHRYLPMEICVIKKGQQLKRLSDVLTAQLIRHSAVPAVDREKNINSIVKEMNYKSDPVAKGFGMSISDRMIEFDGRVLAAPKIEYSGDKKIDVREGCWNMQKVQFFSKAIAKEMAVLNFDNRTSEPEIKKFVNDLIVCAKDAGMILPTPKRYVNLRYVEDVAKCMKSLLPMPHPSLIIVVLPSQKSNDIYGEVKKVGDLEIGIATQCVQSKNVKFIKVQTLNNICLKINVKLGETNSVIAQENKSEIMRCPVMIMGADVTHPAPGDFSNPSIAAVTGSYDAKACRYAARISMQKHRQEIIADLESITVQLLQNFKEKTSREPLKILFYRDGVSEGQFREVLSSELTAIQKACYSFGGANYQPNITFITVQKRHHTRLFAQNPRQQIGKSRNVPAGTTVDTDIVHPIEFDFYLCSHQGIQGTSRPAHYYVLYDDSNFSADVIQDFTYHLCHLYARCTRSVSIPAPAYYAHHCAFRGRYYLDRMGKDGKLPDRENAADGVLKSMNTKCLIHNDYKGMFFA